MIHVKFFWFTASLITSAGEKYDFSDYSIQILWISLSTQEEQCYQQAKKDYSPYVDKQVIEHALDLSRAGYGSIEKDLFNSAVTQVYLAIDASIKNITSSLLSTQKTSMTIIISNYEQELAYKLAVEVLKQQNNRLNIQRNSAFITINKIQRINE